MVFREISTVPAVYPVVNPIFAVLANIVTPLIANAGGSE